MGPWEENQPLVDDRKNKEGSENGTSSLTYASTSETNGSSRAFNSLRPPWYHAICQKLNWVDWDAVYFGVRMSMCITIASFSILLRKPGDEFVPQAMWIVVTVLFVCWFPNSLDAASVVEKSIQRLYGTFLGASTGLSCGFLSLLILDQHQDEEEQNAIWYGGDDDTAALYDEVVITQHSPPALQDDNTNSPAQSAFLISCISIYTFVICWGAIQFKVRKSNAKIITKFNYACILSLLTFYISILPFYSDNGAKWRKARWRVTNVIIGCFLGAGLSISVFPRSTKSIVKHKLQQQLKLAGEASQAVLHAAAEQFSETAYILPAKRTSPTSIPCNSSRERLHISKRLWRRNDSIPSDDDIALTKYEAAMGGWRTIKTQLNNLRYDPFRWGAPDVALTEFRTQVNNTLARIQRIQTTVVLLDGIVKNDPKHNFSAIHINRLARIGTLIRNMLEVQDEEDDTNNAAYTELKAELASIRRDIVELAGVVAKAPQDNAQNYVGKLHKGLIGRSNLDLMAMRADATTEEEEEGDKRWNDPAMNDFGGRGAPIHKKGSRVCALLFLQLVEHLALRSLRTFQAWKQCDAW